MTARAVVVVVLGAGAAWESRALAALAEHPGVVVLKRCVDVADLLATAAAEQAEVAVLGLDAGGLDGSAIEALRQHGLRPVAVVPAEQVDAGQARAVRIGVGTVVADDRLETLTEVVTAPEPDDTVTRGESLLEDSTDVTLPVGGGRVVAVWGPAGAPGRSTVAVAIAADVARRGRRAVLVDADPYGGSVAQQLGILDEVSGLLAASRLAQAGRLEDGVASVQRAVDARLSVVTGLPRPDRWAEVRTGTLERLLEVARGGAEVVVDTGFSLEDDPARDFGTRPARNGLTLAALEVADEALVVGSADPVGLARLARGLVDLREVAPSLPLRVVVNRMRPGLGWSERDVAGMVTGFARLAGLHFLPDDRPAVDRSLVAGRTLLELGESPLTRAVADLVDAVYALPAAPPSTRTRRRRGSGRRG